MSWCKEGEGKTALSQTLSCNGNNLNFSYNNDKLNKCSLKMYIKIK